MTKTQDPRRRHRPVRGHVIGVRVSREEYAALVYVAKVKGLSGVGLVLHDMGVQDAVAYYAEARATGSGHLDRVAWQRPEPITQHPLYQRWRSMWGRCTNANLPGYHRYGGRGITVCDRWRDFRQFVADVGDPPHPEDHLHRIDNDRPYGPGNVEWLSPTEHRQRHGRMRVAKQRVA